MWKLLVLLVLVGISACRTWKLYDQPVNSVVVDTVLQSPFSTSRYVITTTKFSETHTTCYVLHNSYQGPVSISCVNTESEK